jgi:hypothetical protein
VEDAPAPQIYECSGSRRPTIPIVVESKLPPDAVASIVRETAHAIDPAVASGPAPQNLVGAATARRRFETSVLTAFGGVAVLLSAIGLFGLVSYTGRQRRKESAQPRLARAGQCRLAARQGCLTIAGAALEWSRFVPDAIAAVDAVWRLRGDPVSFARGSTL